jgi:hypothetical protein
MFSEFVGAAISATPISNLLASKPAVVLERIARGGGATKWYYCSNTQSLEPVQTRFSPGSVVSFYFDDRIRRESYSPKLMTAIEAVIATHRETIIGTLGEDGILIDAEFVSGPNDLAELLLTIEPGVRVFYGPFPARDNDGVQAVTLTLPDADGTIRAHPH